MGYQMQIGAGSDGTIWRNQDWTLTPPMEETRCSAVDLPLRVMVQLSIGLA